MAIASTKWLRLTAGPGQIMKQAGLIPSMPHTRSNTCATSAEGWASIMRAIKCRKGVRWMPWH